LVIRFARENLGWGYTKIRDALRGLKVEIGRTTVANILAEAGIEPAPERKTKRTWKLFIRSHWETLYACDFFAVETLGMFGTVRIMVFFVIELRTRAVHIAAMRVNPDRAWMLQMARNLLDPVDGFLRNNATMPHSAFRGQTPDEMYFGQGATIPDELALKRREAQGLRVERNRNIACAECPRGVTAVGEDVAA